MMNTKLLLAFLPSILLGQSFNPSQIRCPRDTSRTQIIVALPSSVGSSTKFTCAYLNLNHFSLSSDTPPTVSVVGGGGSGGGSGNSSATVPNFVYAEIPGGTINGTNTVFTINHPPNAGTIALYKNGVRLNYTTDFTISGSTITFLTASLPVVGDILRVDYNWGIYTGGSGSGGSSSPVNSVAGAVGDISIPQLSPLISFSTNIITSPTQSFYVCDARTGTNSLTLNPAPANGETVHVRVIGTFRCNIINNGNNIDDSNSGLYLQGGEITNITLSFDNQTAGAFSWRSF